MAADSVFRTNAPFPEQQTEILEQTSHGCYQGQVLPRRHRLLALKKEATAAVSFREATDPRAGV